MRHATTLNLACAGESSGRLRRSSRVHSATYSACAAIAAARASPSRFRIANYKLPRSVEFVDALPVSGAGKILKGELRAAYT